MKTILLFTCWCAALFLPQIVRAQKNAGIFYTTIFAKERPYKRLQGVGVGASRFFLKDVNGDGKDDAVAYFNNGDWYVTLSDGTYFGISRKYLGYSVPAGVIPMMGDVNGDKKQDAIYFNPADGSWKVALSIDTAFATPVQWSVGNGVGSVDQFLADVNGDGKDDAVIYFHTGLPGYWYVGLSNGTSGFGGFSPWITGFGNTSDQRMMGDVNGDGKVDAVNYTKSSGTWNVALSGGSAFTSAGTWKTGFGINKELGLVYDVDRDGKADVVYYDGGEWWAAYSTGSGIGSYNHRWIMNNRPPNARGNLPAPEAKIIGSMSGSITEACAVSGGDWLCLGNTDKTITGDAMLADTWTDWGNDYEPQVPGHAGTYDAGDSIINDAQLQLMHDAGFTYVMLDITNGVNPWVDNRAKQFIQRIIHWNANLSPGKHKMYFCISMGGSRAATTTDAAMQIIESESQRTWNEFYQLSPNDYYQLNGKPLLVHFVQWPANSNAIINYTGSVPHPYYNNFTIRWMYNAIYNDTIYWNAYGWPIYNQFGNPPGNEVMDVMPGFWNGSSGSKREQGQLYRSQWVRVLQNNPASVWLNSYNESWEHTATEPSYLRPTNTMDNSSMDSTWTDYYGNRMDDFYWVMTKQYTRLYMYNQLFDGSYIQEYGHDEVYKVTGCSFVYQGSMPHQAPVLLVPDSFRITFNGTIIDAAFNQLCTYGAGKAFTTAVKYSKEKEAGPLKVAVFPNPAADHFMLNIRGQEKAVVSIRVTDISGTIVEYNERVAGNSTYQIGEHYVPGVYLLEVVDGNKKVTRRLVKQ